MKWILIIATVIFVVVLIVKWRFIVKVEHRFGLARNSISVSRSLADETTIYWLALNDRKSYDRRKSTYVEVFDTILVYDRGLNLSNKMYDCYFHNGFIIRTSKDTFNLLFTKIPYYLKLNLSVHRSDKLRVSVYNPLEIYVDTLFEERNAE